ncbi:MAG: LysM peptidoglycan-binding domain-containing protein [Firmicutes bacterium]|nr:LysM peptidoglycan-binding domain-containing protein [Bacillota bacterium]
MKKIIPFNNEITFKTNINEITSISLDHNLKLDDNSITGDLVISGSYKINDISINLEEFKYDIPIDIEIGKNYNLDEVLIDIEDFYYEIINNNVLSVNIEVSIDNLKEIPMEENVKNPIILEDNIVAVDKIEENTVENLERIEVSDVKSLFDGFEDSNESFSTYKVCIVKENDTLESIILNYGISKEELIEYNDVSNIKPGDKLIIPSNDSIK